MSHIIIKASTHQEWLDARRGGIGSSEVATLLGVNPWQTPYQLWLQKTRRVPEEEKESFLMKAGHYLEDAVSRFCADETGLQIIKNSSAEFVVVNRERPYLRVSPDRYAWKPGARRTKGNKVIIECKTTQNSVDEDNIPPYWFVQVMYQLGVTEMEEAVIAWLTQGRSFGYKWLTFDKDFYEDVIVDTVERFWVDNIKGGREPELTNIDDVLIKYPKQTEGSRVMATEEIIDIYEELKATNEELKRLKELKERAEEQIKMSMLDGETLYIPATLEHPSRTLATWKKSKDSTVFDVDRFQTENPQEYNKYLIPKPGIRRFNLK